MGTLGHLGQTVLSGARLKLAVRAQGVKATAASTAELSLSSRLF